MAGWLAKVYAVVYNVCICGLCYQQKQNFSFKCVELMEPKYVGKMIQNNGVGCGGMKQDGRIKHKRDEIYHYQNVNYVVFGSFKRVKYGTIRVLIPFNTIKQISNMKEVEERQRRRQQQRRHAAMMISGGGGRNGGGGGGDARVLSTITTKDWLSRHQK